MRTPLPSLAATGLALGLTACEDPAPKPQAALVTTATFQYLAANDVATFGAGLDAVFPGGFPTKYFMKDEGHLRVASAYTDGLQGAYMTTDVWVNFPAVWVQPLYIFVTDPNLPAATALDNTMVPWIFSVGDASKFYSPYWRIYWVVVPDVATAQRYKTVRDILDAKLPLLPGPGRLATLTPDKAFGHDEAPLLLPRLKGADGALKLGKVKKARGLVEGKERWALDFGDHRFEWNERDEVLEQPLFFFFYRRPGKSAWEPDRAIPRVGGTGPLFARRPELAPGNRPAFGSLWRLWGVRLPATARMVVPAGTTQTWDDPSASETPPVPRVTVDPIDGVDLDAYAFKVVLDGKCLQPDPATMAPPTKAQFEACAWLDSQEAIEEHLPTSLARSEILVACPYLSYDEEEVPNP